MLQSFFSVFDIAVFISYLMIAVIGAHIIRARNKDKPLFTYYLPHFYWKIFFSTAFGLTYLLYYGGGDTTAYWEGATALNRLFYHSPQAYFTELFSSHDASSSYAPSYFSVASVGRPPMWIYRDPNSWFVSKVASVFSFFTFGSYLSLNLLFGLISSWISWRFFLFAKQVTEIKTRNVALATLFIPSVGFWCGSLMKDTIVYCASLIGTMGFVYISQWKSNKKVVSVLLIICAAYFLLHTRSFVFLALLVGFLAVFIFKKYSGERKILNVLGRFVLVICSLGLLAWYFSNAQQLGDLSPDELLKKAEITQKDFQTNTLYTGKRYDIGNIDFTVIGLLKSAPAAIATTLFKPFIWEASNPLMLLNGLENILFFVLFIQFVLQFRQRKKLPLTSSNLLVFSLVFVLLMAFFIGITSGLYGVLVRMKTGMLVFLLLIFFSKKTE
ncbi:MAG: hypothetical protein RLZZ493_673 [Bacteroidota bacterium]|jgi:hypothetical protein